MLTWSRLAPNHVANREPQLRRWSLEPPIAGRLCRGPGDRVLATVARGREQSRCGRSV